MKQQLIVLFCIGLFAVTNAFNFNPQYCGGHCTFEYAPICAYDRRQGLYIFDNQCLMDMANQCRGTRFVETYFWDCGYDY